ncbi:MAG: hypothetical protein PHZ19_02020, partial [Candidatus Thermoplasmatota archaeon]|nr:hypothetical protein [Candidatus Thermoplasmatota archaeon]
MAQQNVFVYLNKLLGYNIIRELKPDEIIEQANSLKAHRLASRPKRTPRGINGIQFYTLTDQAKRFFSSWTQWQWEITAQDREEIQLYKQRLEKLLTEISRQQNKRKNQQKERTRRNKEQQRQEAAARERKRELLSRAKELAAPYLEAGRELLKEQDHERYRNIYVFMRHVFMYASALQLSPWEILEKHLPPDMVRAIRDMN